MMKRSLGFVLALALAGCESGAGKTSAKIAWVTDYTTGMEQAAGQGKPVILFFTAPT